MSDTPSRNYHDYCIKDGRFIGQFEAMYAACDMPWHQDEQESLPDIRLGIELLREFGPFGAIHDLAAGTGHFLNILHRNFGTARISGTDISASACKQATTRFPAASFFVDDLKRPGKTAYGADVNRPLYVLRGTLWCLYPEIKEAIDHLPSRVGPNGMLYVAQNFPPLDSQFVGKEIMPTPQVLAGMLDRQFKCKRSLWFENRDSRGNDNWFCGIFTLLA